jgi:hypothetical protein
MDDNAVRLEVDPAESVAAAIARLWAEVTEAFHPDGRIEVANRDVDLFEAGATSLLGMILISRLYDETGITLPFASLLDNPTIRLLAEHLISLGDQAAETVAEALPDSK